MSESSPVVLIVDDDLHVCNAFARLVRSAGHEVETLDSAGDLLSRVSSTQRPVCVLLDLMLSDMDGLAVQRRLGMTAPIVFISARGNMQSAIEAMKAGAVDFLEKPVDGDVLLASVARALREAGEQFEHRKRSTEIQLRLDLLTRREREVMMLVASGHPNKIIAAKLGAAEKTIKIHRARGMEKMQMHTVPDLVRCLIEFGLLVTDYPDAARIE